MTKRHSAKDIEAWHRDGGVVIPGIVTPDVVAACHGDMDTFYADRGKGEGVGTEKNLKGDGQIGAAKR